MAQFKKIGTDNKRHKHKKILIIRREQQQLAQCKFIGFNEQIEQHRQQEHEDTNMRLQRIEELEISKHQRNSGG